MSLSPAIASALALPEPERTFAYHFATAYQPDELLKRPQSVAELRQIAMRGAEHAAWKFAQVGVHGDTDGNEVSGAIHSACAAFREALDYILAAAGKADGCAFVLPMFLLPLAERIKREIAILKGDPTAAKAIEHHETFKRREAERWKGKGTRGLDTDAPRNRLVLRLLGVIEDVQSQWKFDVSGERGLPESEREAFKAKLHERVREMIALPPLSLATARDYHRVGLAMLRDATGTRGTHSFTAHPAFKRGGEFYELVNSAKSFAGTLGEAWKSVARIVTKGH